MGMQVSCSVYPERAEERVVWEDTEVFGAGVSRIGTAEKESDRRTGHMLIDHVHMLISIPPKYAVAEVIGYIKGKSAIAIARQFGGRKWNFSGERFWAKRLRSIDGGV